MFGFNKMKQTIKEPAEAVAGAEEFYKEQQKSFAAFDAAIEPLINERSSDDIKEAFDLYFNTLVELQRIPNNAENQELIANIVLMSQRHLCQNLDKAMVLFKEDTHA